MFPCRTACCPHGRKKKQRLNSITDSFMESSSIVLRASPLPLCWSRRRCGNRRSAIVDPRHLHLLAALELRGLEAVVFFTCPFEKFLRFRSTRCCFLRRGSILIRGSFGSAFRLRRRCKQRHGRTLLLDFFDLCLHPFHPELLALPVVC